MKQKKGKKAGSGSDAEREKLRKDLTDKGPLRLRKYALTGLNIPAEIVDEWNDFDYMVDYCVAKEMGDPLPEAGEDDGEDTYSEGGEFDASEMAEDSDGEFDDEMEGDSDGEFDASEEEESDDSPEEEEEVTPPKASVAKKRQPKEKKPKKPAPPAGDGDIGVQLQGLLDVITNQGVVLDKLQKAVTAQKSTVEEIYVRQQAGHRALAAIAKTLWQVSTFVVEFVPRALKAMKFKPQVSKTIKANAETAAKSAEELISGLLDPEAD